MDVNQIAEKAVEFKNAYGFNCCQAVTYALSFETETDIKILNDIASGFGLGMGTTEGVCGALVGAGMIAGIKCEGRATVRQTREILTSFKALSGAIYCKDLKGIETGKVLCSCDDCVKNAVKAYAGVMGLSE